MKIIQYLFLLFFSLFFSFSAFAAQQNLTIKWNSPQGIKILQNSQHKNDFYQLADHFQPQINPLYCGIATSVIILNSINENHLPNQKTLQVQKPAVFGSGFVPFQSYSQLTFLNDKTDKIKDRKIIKLKNITKDNENDAKNFDPGLKLAEFKDILSKAYGLKAKFHYADKLNEKSIDKFRQIAKKTTAEDKKYLAVNFKGKLLGLKTNGHISPVAAFDEASDSVLILDVAGHKNGWFWVKIPDLFKAMHSKDGDDYRGYLIIR
jgi:hypothetical protein